MWNILPTRIDRQPLFLNSCGSVTASGCCLRKSTLALVTTPVVSGRKPVIREARLGPQNGNWQYALSKRTPRAASRSMCGDLTIGWP